MIFFTSHMSCHVFFCFRKCNDGGEGLIKKQSNLRHWIHFVVCFFHYFFGK